MKVCTICKEPKELAKFGTDKRNVSGKRGQCKECLKLKQAQYILKNKSIVAVKAREYREANKEVLATKAKEYYQANKEVLATKGREYREANKEVLATKKKEYYSTPVGRTKKEASEAKRRVLKVGTTINNTELDNYLIECVYTFCRFKNITTGTKHHVDHIIPISKGGAHHWKNMQVLTATENLKKGAKL